MSFYTWWGVRRFSGYISVTLDVVACHNFTSFSANRVDVNVAAKSERPNLDMSDMQLIKKLNL